MPWTFRSDRRSNISIIAHTYRRFTLYIFYIFQTHIILRESKIFAAKIERSARSRSLRSV